MSEQPMIEEAWEAMGFCPCGDEHCEEEKQDARALALAAHDDACEGCSCYIEGSPGEAHARATCPRRAKIAALPSAERSEA